MTVKKPSSGHEAEEVVVFKEQLCGEVEEESEGSSSLSLSPSSSETDSSPRRPRKCEKKKKRGHLHSQVLRVREEDLHIGEDNILMEVFCGKDFNKFTTNNNNISGVGSPLKSVVNLSRPSMLPCSPLSGKIATVNNLMLDQDVGGN